MSCSDENIHRTVLTVSGAWSTVVPVALGPILPPPRGRPPPKGPTQPWKEASRRGWAQALPRLRNLQSWPLSGGTRHKAGPQVAQCTLSSLQRCTAHKQKYLETVFPCQHLRKNIRGSSSLPREGPASPPQPLLGQAAQDPPTLPYPTTGPSFCKLSSWGSFSVVSVLYPFFQSGFTKRNGILPQGHSRGSAAKGTLFATLRRRGEGLEETGWELWQGACPWASPWRDRPDGHRGGGVSGMMKPVPTPHMSRFCLLEGYGAGGEVLS